MFKTGRYEIAGEIGRGSMGVVYEGFDPLINRKVAIKTMRTEGLSDREYQDYKARFQSEAQSAGALAHPNIVTIHDFGEDHGVLYLAMEFLDGISLRQLLDEKGVLPIQSIIPIFQQVSSALDYAHSHQIVHRDIKPANIMILESGVVKVTDFGIAKVLSTETSMTLTGQILGTPTYMSPEQVKGQPVDGRSDIFSLGVILYELVTGQKPFGGQNVTTVMYKIINEPPVSPLEAGNAIHPGLAHAIGRALAKDPDLRYQTCRELADDLTNYGQLGRISSSGETVVMQRPRLATAETRPAQKVARFPRAAWVGAAVLAVAGVLIGGYYLSRLTQLPVAPTRNNPPVSSQTANSQTISPEKSAAPAATGNPVLPKPEPGGEPPFAAPYGPSSASASDARLESPTPKMPVGKGSSLSAGRRRKNAASASSAGVTRASHSATLRQDKDVPANSRLASAGATDTKKQAANAQPAQVAQQPANPTAPPTGSAVSPAPDGGSSEYILETDPSGVDVFIDGKLVGRTGTDKDNPLIANLAVGDHTFVLKYHGAEVWKGQLKKTADAGYKKWRLPITEPVQ